METLRGLADFTLFRLVPQEGRYVRGFGQAYSLGGVGIVQVDPEPDRG